jgi:hypothetical protein
VAVAPLLLLPPLLLLLLLLAPAPVEVPPLLPVGRTDTLPLPQATNSTARAKANIGMRSDRIIATPS